LTPTNPKFIDVEPIDDYETVVVDGAYIHYYEGFLSLLFFRDKEFPSHDEKGDVTKTRTRREILHEVRMAIKTAKTVFNELDEGLSAYSELGWFLKDREFWTSPKIGKPSELTGFSGSRDNMDGIVWSNFSDMYKNCTKAGQNKILDKLTQFLHDNLEDIRTIAEKHAKNKKKVYKINDRRK
jgi:hypothetical protein